MKSINITQKELKEILESFYKKGNEKNMKTIDFVEEMVQNLQSYRCVSTEATK